MKLSALGRKTHYWVAAVVALPILVVLCSGLLLQIKKQWPWVQPAELRGTGTAPSVDLDRVLASVRGVPALAVRGWSDVNRVDIRPGKGLAKVYLHTGWEAQVDLGTGRVLSTGYRRSDWIEAIHDGSFFAGDVSKLGIFLPSGLALLALWVTGLWMFWLPLWVRIRRRKRSRPSIPAGRSSALG
jgi:hypothetical protein